MSEKTEYIEREAAVKELNEWAIAAIKENSIATAAILSSVRDIINKLPAADVKERKRSKRHKRHEVFEIILYINTFLYFLGAIVLPMLPLPDVKWAGALSCVAMGFLSVTMIHFLYGGKYPLC